LNRDNLRALPNELRSLRGLARSCVLAACKSPALDSEWVEDAASAFNDLAWDQDLLGKVEFEDSLGRLHISLFQQNNPLSINQQLLRDGWLRILNKPDTRISHLVSTLREDEAMAKKKRLNVWHYGDVSDPEEDDKEAKGSWRGKHDDKKQAWGGKPSKAAPAAKETTANTGAKGKKDTKEKTTESSEAPAPKAKADKKKK